MSPYTILGLHHVTATVDAAQADLDFCLGVLGLRLVKKTVNFDNHHVYHFYYGSERGAPGTIWTTFPYRGYGVAVGLKGAGQIATTSFSVPASSLGFWRRRFRDAGVEPRDVETPFGEAAIRVDDPSGLWFHLVGNVDDRRAPWTGGGVGSDEAIRGLHSVTMMVRSRQPTLELMTGLLGFHVVHETDRAVRIAVGAGGPGHTIDTLVDPVAAPGVNGTGTVHHVAVAIATADEQRRLRGELLAMGLRVTEIRDRCYFQSIYFREPGGVLLEVATVEPGFAVDEDVESLGRALKLPPWEESNRADIEAHLPRVEYR
jgi:glyoxalase family protein